MRFMAAPAVILLFCLGCESGDPQDSADIDTAGFSTNITEFRPGKGQVIDLDLVASLPEAREFGQAVREYSIDKHIEQYRIDNGSYPADFQSFVDKIIVPNEIAIPDLPPGLSCQYDVTNHRLVIVSAATTQGSDEAAVGE